MMLRRDREFTVLCPNCYRKVASGVHGREGKAYCPNCGRAVRYNVDHLYQRTRKPAKVLLKRRAKQWLVKEE